MWALVLVVLACGRGTPGEATHDPHARDERAVAPGIVGEITHIEGTTTVEEFEGTIRSEGERLRACGELGTGAVHLELVIDQTGRVIRILPEADHPGIGSCVVSLFSSVRFPPHRGGRAAVKYTLRFS